MGCIQLGRRTADPVWGYTVLELNSGRNFTRLLNLTNASSREETEPKDSGEEVAEVGP